MSNNFLFDENPLVIQPRLAEYIGLNEAIILQQINYWLKKSGKYIDGRVWIYNTYKTWNEQFPFFSVSTIRRAISNLEKEKILITGNYNKAGFDKTKWYSIDNDVLTAKINSACVQNEQTMCSKRTDGVVQNEHTNTRDYTETTTDKAQSKDMRTSHQNDSNEQELKDNFDKLWKLYPNKKDKQRAFKAYKKAVKEGTANKDIQDGILAYKKYVEQERANGFEQLKYKDGSTFFNGRNWEDEYPVKDSVSRQDISNSIAGLTADEKQNGEFMKLVNKFYGRSDFSGNKYTLAVIRKMYAYDRHE